MDRRRSRSLGMDYQKDKWTNDYQFKYYLKVREKRFIHPIIDEILLEVYEEISKKGINSVINKKTLKKIYNKHIEQL